MVPNNRCTGAREAGLVIGAEGHRAPGEQVVRHLTSREISETEIAVDEKCWRTVLIFDNRLDSNDKA
jgi:hypothetical protein